mmetsp:Transcript_27111/g.73060  ORF Transcript_27111/g.73060 Transcript_27111/m.73060 type:complete len:241 (+) Transcript_27111:211-933(+)
MGQFGGRWGLRAITPIHRHAELPFTSRINRNGIERTPGAQVECGLLTVSRSTMPDEIASVSRSPARSSASTAKDCSHTARAISTDTEPARVPSSAPAPQLFMSSAPATSSPVAVATLLSHCSLDSPNVVALALVGKLSDRDRDLVRNRGEAPARKVASEAVGPPAARTATFAIGRSPAFRPALRPAFAPTVPDLICVLPPALVTLVTLITSPSSPSFLSSSSPSTIAAPFTFSSSRSPTS